MIKIGACIGVDLEKIKQAKIAGCDYVELSFYAMATLSEEEFTALKETLANNDMTVPAANSFIGGEFQITGDEADLRPIEEYLKKSYIRGQELGIKTIIFGSSGARNMPEGFTDKEKAFEQCVEFLKMAGSMAKEHGIRIAIEPLRREEANHINTLKEGLALAKATDMENVGLLSDFYHQVSNGEDIADVLLAGDMLWHCHIARKLDRHIPDVNDVDDYAKYFKLLKEINYDNCVSTEGNSDNFLDDVTASMKYLRTFI